MAASNPSEAPQNKHNSTTRERHPPGLAILFLTEMWERFSFYLMLGILPLYLSDSQKGGMGWTDEKAATVVGTYIAMVYFTPFIGGLLADRLLGYRRAILIGAGLMMAGHLVLAWPTEIGLYLGLLLLVLGNGAFKSNISTLLGNLYPKDSKLKDAGYSIFYMGINVGAFSCNLIAAIVRNYFDDHPWQITANWKLEGWHAAFGTAAIGMLLGLILFACFYRRFERADNAAQLSAVKEDLTPLWLECLLPAAAIAALFWFVAGQGWLPFSSINAAFIGACIPVLVFYVRMWRKLTVPAERDKVAALLVLFLVVIIFWAVFHLNTTALTVWTRDNTDRVPSPTVEKLISAVPEFAENAPPEYFKNASPATARPELATFDVVTPEVYTQKKEARELKVADGEKVFVTQKMLDEILAKADASTPQLPPGKHLQVVNTELFQSINPAFVILLTPILVGFFHFLRTRGWEPSTPAKIGLGLLITGIGPLIMWAATQSSGDGAVKASVGWLFGTYAAATLGELCLSPMGLSFVNKLSPAQIRAFMMGGWFLSTSVGNKLSGIFGELYQKVDHSIFWLVLCGACVFFAGIMFALLPWFKRAIRE
jgi:POT family proton-dependent oligopeptide transporter